MTIKINKNMVCLVVSAILVAVVFTCTPVFAALTGEAALRYDNYESRDKFGKHVSGGSFTQDYSILYSHSGSIYNSRIGKYNVSLGYNWSALDTSIKANGVSDSVNTSRGHILYNGELLVDPKEVPIRLHAYSRDTTRNTITTTDRPLLRNTSYQTGALFDSPNLATGINDGLHIESGATLVAGLKNGMTNGYNEFLRHFPMIMLDYSDQIHRDLRSQNPVDSRLSRLAFVSLNKKDNWFHYRYVTFDDYLNSSNNYRESQFQLGTVDHKLSRRWIDFTNWLEVSTDLQLTRRTNSNMAMNFFETDYNFFVKARRSKWEARSFANFNRYREENGPLTYRTTLPLYVSGVYSPDISWSTRTSYRESHNDAGARLDSIYAGYRVELFKRSLFNLTNHFDLESSVSERSDLLTLSAGIETNSSPQFSKKFTVGGSYTIKNSTSSSDSSNSTDFLEQKVSFRSTYVPTSQLRIYFNQSNEFTSGNQQGFTSLVRDANTTLPQYVTPRGIAMNDMGDSSYRSLTSLSAAWNPRPRLNLGLSLSEDIYSSEKTKSSNITKVSLSLDYENAKIKFSNMLSYSEGSNVVDFSSSSISNQTSLQYNHSRNLDSMVKFTFSRQSDNVNTSSNYDFEQRINYSYFSYSGMPRKLFEINEMFTYSNSPNLSSSVYSSSSNYSNIQTSNTVLSQNTNVSAGKSTSRSSFSLGFKYYPLRQLVLAGGARYQYDAKVSNYSLLWYSSISTSYRLFQASLDYYQGKRATDGLMERKFTANVKKTF